MEQDDGTFKVSLPMSGEKKFPIIDANADTGMLSTLQSAKVLVWKGIELIVVGHLTKALVQVAPSINLLGATSMICWNEYCEIWSQNGVKCTFATLDRKVLEDTIGLIVKEIADMFQGSEYLTANLLF